MNHPSTTGHRYKRSCLSQAYHGLSSLAKSVLQICVPMWFYRTSSSLRASYGLLLKISGQTSRLLEAQKLNSNALFALLSITMHSAEDEVVQQYLASCAADIARFYGGQEAVDRMYAGVDDLEQWVVIDESDEYEGDN